MASKATEVVELSQKNVQYIERLLYDVLVVTLPICGLPKTTLPTPNCEENTYETPNFVESACAAVLMKSFVIRNKWSTRMWNSILSEESSCDFDFECIPLFLMATFEGVVKDNTKVNKNFQVEMAFGACNEIMLHVHHQKIDCDFNKLLKCVSKFIANTVAPNLNIIEIIDEFFMKFDNVSLYMKWITDFAAKFALPYGSTEDVSDVFEKCFAKLWIAGFDHSTYPDIPRIKMKNPETFSLHDAFSDIATEESGHF